MPLVFSVEFPAGRDDSQVMFCWKGDMGVDDFALVPLVVAKELLRQLSPSAADRDIETVTKVSNARLDRINDLLAALERLEAPAAMAFDPAMAMEFPSTLTVTLLLDAVKQASAALNQAKGVQS